VVTVRCEVGGAICVCVCSVVVVGSCRAVIVWCGPGGAIFV